jgi:hypothetical protein
MAWGYLAFPMPFNMQKSTLIFRKALLSIPVGVGLAYPFIDPDAGNGMLRELSILGVTGSVAAAVLLVFVRLHARDLKRSLELVFPVSRRAKTASVSLMFLLPYNFFFIVGSVSKSLKAEAAINPVLARLSLR